MKNLNIKSLGLLELSNTELIILDGGVTEGPNGGCIPTMPWEIKVPEPFNFQLLLQGGIE